MIASGSSSRGLSLVTITRSAMFPAISPIGARFSTSRSPPQPNTHRSRPSSAAEPSLSSGSDMTSRSVASAFSSASGVCA